MKNLKLMGLLMLVLTLNSCWQIEEPCCTAPFRESEYQAITLQREVFESTVQLLEPKTLIENAGKIYIKDNLLFINDKYKGFHVYDNTNPETPKKINFINIPGATDMAIRNNIIFVNQATDLISLEYLFSEQSMTVAKRIKNVFPELYSPDGYHEYGINDDEIVVDWKLKN